jgi:hypothetical protein
MKAPMTRGSVPAPGRSIASNRIQRKATAAKPLKRRVVAIALGAVLAIYVVLNYVSHQGLHASQNQSRSSSPVVPEKGTIPGVRNSERAAVPAESAPTPVTEPPTALEPPEAEPRPEPQAERKAELKSEQILRNQVKAFWESGKYSEAMRLVDQVLATSPGNPEARAWKKRIRAAQEAEAAIK